MAACQDYTAQEAQQGRLHGCESLETDFTPRNAWKASRVGRTERILHAVKTYRLLLTNHFGARKQRSAEQALLLLQEQIYTAWQGRKIASLISFDVKGAYNGVYKERLLQRIKARGILEMLLQ